MASYLLRPSSGGIAVASLPAVSAPIAADTPVIVSLLPVEPPETYINIVDTGQGERVIAMIEILSPVNKALGEGRNSYLAKQGEVLHSQTHLIEIDLLRAGASTVAVGHPLMPDVGRYEYLVCLHRGGQAQFEVWPCSIRQRLPRIAVPLASGDADVALDLQAAIDRCYERRGFAQRIDYSQPPELPLTEEDAAWAEALLREKGLRS